ncbi:MAG: hypothetical protein AAF581_22205 [Planctomycetota bacterium]
MISVMEKGLWVLGVLLLGLIGVFFVYLGPPPTISRLEVKAQKINEGILIEQLKPEARKRYQDLVTAPPPKTPDGKPSKIGRPQTTEIYKVNRATYYLINSKQTAMGEARKAGSEVIDNGDGTNSLKITSFGEGSLLHDVGMKDGDVVDTINGRKIDFSSTIDATSLYEDCVAQLDAGNPIVVNIRRRNKPMRIVVAGDWDLKKAIKRGAPKANAKKPTNNRRTNKR